MLQYYTLLYATDPIDKKVTQSFFDKIALPTVTSSQLETLNAPIFLSEISTTNLHLKHQAPMGIQGNTIRPYKIITEPTLLNVYRGMWSGGPFLPTGNQAIIKLLSKKGNAPLEPGSYRPK